jgi:hypothetical protein
METHTPIPYWLSMPWVAARVWSSTVIKIHRDDQADQERG